MWFFLKTSCCKILKRIVLKKKKKINNIKVQSPRITVIIKQQAARN